MSIWYDPKMRKPQLWTHVAFVLLTVLFLWTTYAYGDKKAKQQEAQPLKGVHDLK